MLHDDPIYARNVDLIRRVANTAAIVDRLDHLFGREVTAKMAGVADPKRVDLWLTGKTTPRRDILQRLIVADEAAHVIESEFSEDTTRGWFFRTNPYLDRHTPVEYLKVNPQQVLFAARAFADGE